MTKAFDYQREAVLQIERFGGRALLSLEPGLGKTYCSLLWSHWNPDVRPMIVVCPASIKWQWERECSTHFGYLADVLEGMKPFEEGEMRTNHPIVIINYDILKPWMEYLLDLNPKLIVFDECHYLCNRSAKRTKLAARLASKVPHVIALSGTPLTNRPAELWPILNMLRPDKFSKFWDYAEDYCAPVFRHFGWEFKGATNLEQLHKKLTKYVMIRKTKKEIFTQLPAKIRSVIPVKMIKEKEYIAAEKDIISWLGKHSPEKARKAKKAEKLVKFGYLKRLAAKLKLNSCYEWIDNFLEDTGKKLVIFCIQKEVVNHLKERYTTSCVVVNGEVGKTERQKAVDQFISNRHTRLFIGNIQAAGLGLDGLNRATDSVAFLEMEWTPGKNSQAEDRVYGRLSDLHGANIFYLVAHGTVEERLARLIQQKQRILDSTLDGIEGSSDFDIMDLLEKEMIKERLK